MLIRFSGSTLQVISVLVMASCSNHADVRSGTAPPVSLATGEDPQLGVMVYVTGSPGHAPAEVHIDRLRRYELPPAVFAYRGPAAGAPLGRWVDVPIVRAPAPDTIRFDVNGHGVPLATLAGAPLPVGLYVADATVAGHRVRQSFHNGSVHCNDVMLGAAPPGLEPMCIPHERGAIATFVPRLP